MKTINKNYNLSKLYSQIALEWGYSRNLPLIPENISPGSHKKVWWICKEGHEWEAIVYNRTRGNNCPYCSGRYSTENNNLEIKYPEIAKEWHPVKNKLLAKEVTPKSNKKVWWVCKKGHEWKARVGTRVCSNTGCPYCSGRLVTKNNNLEIKFPEIAKQWNYTLNKKVLPNSVTPFSNKKVWWVCNRKHVWKTQISSRTKNMGECPKCSIYKSEIICRLVFEKLFNNKFSQTWLSIIKNKTGRTLQLDGYCKNFNIAFEYQGIQHYKIIKYFNNKKSIKENVERDKIKVKLCNKHRIKLFVIPYTVFEKCKTLREKIFNLLIFIKKEALKIEIILPENINIIIIQEEIYNNVINKIHNIYKTQDAQETEKVRKIVLSKKGKIIEGKYEGFTSPFKIKCIKGHVWNTQANYLKRNRWCPKCADTKLSLGLFKNIAINKEGECLSKKYINIYTKLKFKCKEGHTWEAAPKHIKFSNTWCSKCANNYKLSLKLFKDIAKEKGGECLSKKYINIHTKLKFKCRNGHTWEVLPNSVKNNNTWCLACYKLGRKKLCI